MSGVMGPSFMRSLRPVVAAVVEDQKKRLATTFLGIPIAFRFLPDSYSACPTQPPAYCC